MTEEGAAKNETFELRQTNEICFFPGLQYSCPT